MYSIEPCIAGIYRTKWGHVEADCFASDFLVRLIFTEDEAGGGSLNEAEDLYCESTVKDYSPASYRINDGSVVINTKKAPQKLFFNLFLRLKKLNLI